LSLRRFQSIEWTHKGDRRSSDTKAKAMELVDSSQSRLTILSRAWPQRWKTLHTYGPCCRKPSYVL